MNELAFVGTHTVSVSYSGSLPDLFREGQGVVAEGVLEAPGQFHADRRRIETSIAPARNTAISPQQLLKPIIAATFAREVCSGGERIKRGRQGLTR